MKHRLIRIGLAFTIGLGCISIMIGWVHHQAQASLSLRMQQVNQNGFGDYLNKQIPSLAAFDDYLYAGTWHWFSETASAQIWRSADGMNWEQVDDQSRNGTAAMISYKDSLYAASWDGYVWSSPDGLSWTDIITDGFDGSNQGIAHFAVFSDALYASTWTDGSQIWRTDNGTDWEPWVIDGLGDPNNFGAPSSEIFNGYLYWGVGNAVTGAQLWRTDGITTTAVITDGFGSLANEAVSSLALYHDMLYAGISSFQNGVQIFRSTDGTDWLNVPGDFTHPQANAVNALEEYNGQLYLFVQNDATGLEVWRSANGLDWAQVGFNGFGDAANTITYWDNATLVFKDKLYTGVQNWPEGVEVWQLSEVQNTYLPLVFKNYSPADRGKIAFVSNPDGLGEIFSMNDDGSGVIRLTHNTSEDSSPDWSPDGSRIAFASNRSAAWEIYVMNADGSGQTQLTTLNRCYSPQWSPDGTKIVFYSRQSNNNIIFTMHPDGTHVFQVTDPAMSAYDPSWSPDGSKIAFISTRTTPGIYVIDADGTNQELVLESIDIVYFSWSPDGKKLALSKYALPNTNFDLYVYDFASEATTRITDTSSNHNSVDWSPDSRQLIFYSNLDDVSNWDIYTISLDGFYINRLTDQPAVDSEADWVK